jgi:ribonuclease HI
MDTSTIQVFIDGSKSEKGVGEGIAIYKFGDLINSLKYKLNIKCTNNQAEQLAILKALKYTVNIHVAVKTATVYTGSRITLDCLKNNGIHGALVEKIKQQLTEIKKCNGTSNFARLKLTLTY